MSHRQSRRGQAEVEAYARADLLAHPLERAQTAVHAIGTVEPLFSYDDDDDAWRTLAWSACDARVILRVTDRRAETETTFSVTSEQAERLAYGLLAKAVEAGANLTIEQEADAAADAARAAVYAKYNR